MSTAFVDLHHASPIEVAPCVKWVHEMISLFFL